MLKKRPGRHGDNRIIKFLVTGTNGVLGEEIFNILKGFNIDVTKFVRTLIPIDQIPNSKKFLEQFDFIIHAAANTNVEECEANSLKCYEDNTYFTERLCKNISEDKCKFIFISSTGIYGNHSENKPFLESDKVQPTTHYHNSKWLAEEIIRQNSDNHLIIRAGWIFGGSPEKPKNFVARRIEEAFSALRSGKKLYSNMEQFGSPTYSIDLSRTIIDLAMDNQIGTFNVVNNGQASRFEYVSRIIEFADIDIDVLPVNASTFERKANVSNNESAISSNLLKLGYNKLPNWEDSLQFYIFHSLRPWIEDKRISTIK